MGCSGSSTAASSPSQRYAHRRPPCFIGKSQTRSLPVPTGFNDYEAAYVDQIVMFASVLGDYERGRYNTRQARDLADQHMRSCGEISACGHIDYQRTKLLMERRGLSEHVRRHLERLYKELQYKTQDLEIESNGHRCQPSKEALRARQRPFENGASIGNALQHRLPPTLLSSPGPEKQHAISRSDKPQTAGFDNWTPERPMEYKIKTIEERRIHETREHEGLWDWVIDGGLERFFGLDNTQTKDSDDWTATQEKQNWPRFGITESRVRTERREFSAGSFNPSF